MKGDSNDLSNHTPPPNIPSKHNLCNWVDIKNYRVSIIKIGK